MVKKQSLALDLGLGGGSTPLPPLGTLALPQKRKGA